jgi:hypothetical protein
MIPTRIYVALVTVWATCIGTHAKTTTVLIPFSLELTSGTSDASILMDNNMNQDLIDGTVDHLESYVGSDADEALENLESVTLKVEKISTKDKGEEDDGYVLVASFVGSLNFMDESGIPTEKELTVIQWGAFVGQAKIDYLSVLRTKSSNEFLQTVSNVKVLWTPVSQSSLSSILIAIAVGIISAFILLACYTYLSKLRKQKAQFGDGKQGRDPRELELAETGSMSPANTPRALEAGDRPMFFDGAGSIRMGKTVATKDTIDVRTGMDMMLTWKHSQKTERTPFETDITRISKSDGNSIQVQDETVDIEKNVDMMGWKCGDNVTPFDADVTGITKSSPNKTLEINLRKGKKNKKSRSSSRTGTTAPKSKSKPKLYNDATPFLADITEITEMSPNKTLEINLCKEREIKKSRSSSRNGTMSSKSKKYLTKDALAHHYNETEFDDHAKR